jgi:hypothetical protein
MNDQLRPEFVQPAQVDFEEDRGELISRLRNVATSSDFRRHRAGGTGRPVPSGP